MELQSQHKQKSFQSQTPTRFDAIQGTIHVIDVHSLPGIYKQHNLWHNEIFKRRNELISWANSSGAGKLFHSIIKQNSLNEHLSAQDLLTLMPTKANEELVKSLKNNPGNHQARLQLVNNICKAEADFGIEAYRDNLFQALLPLSVGYCSTDSFQTIVAAYQTYLNHLRRDLQKKKHMMEQQAKIADGETQQEHLNYLKHLETNNKVLQMLFELSRSKEVRQFESSPFYLYDVYLSVNKAASIRKQYKDTQTPLSKEPRKIVANLEQLLNISRFFPVLYALAIEDIKKLQQKYPERLLSYIILGRIYMQATHLAIMRHLSGEEQCIPLVKQFLHASLEAYGKGKRFVVGDKGSEKLRNMLLREYTNTAMQLFKYSSALRVPPSVMSKILTICEDNMDRMQSDKDEDALLFRQVQTALSSI
ncbi:hypothetical protein WDW89_18905 [Deltaproteobacteria bacterium TL4]